jgi:signal transduction histidine kinase
MAWPPLLTNLHVRVAALFLGLLIVVGAVYYAWMMHTVLAPPKLDPDEKRWYKELASVEMDSLAQVAAGGDRAHLAELALEYGRRIAVYDAEVVFVDAERGRVLAASDPDSLAAAVGQVDVQLLHDMVSTDWSYSTIYPDPSNIDAYVNRIFHVATVAGDDGGPAAYLVGTWRPWILTVDDVTLNSRQLWFQAIIVGLAAAILVGAVVVAWLTRRIRSLSAAVGALAAGDLGHRVRDRSPDDLGRLGRDLNAMAARLETLVGELRNKEQFQSQLIANISHDLRTPMASLRGHIETLSLRGDRAEPATYRRYLDTINENLDQMDRLVGHLLQLSRLDAGQTLFQTEDFRLPELAGSVMAWCGTGARAKGIRLDCRYPADLPLVHADPLQIGQVLQNLVENGIKFGQEGGEIVVDLQPDRDGRVAVAVRDDGPGIAPEDLPHIFERFFTGDRSRSRKGQSSGLGLAIAAKIVEGHGSRLTVSSEFGRGACFRFGLPAAASSPIADGDDDAD